MNVFRISLLIYILTILVIVLSSLVLSPFEFVDEITSFLIRCNPFASLSLLSNIIMAGRICLFQSAQRYQRLMGIYATELNERAPFNYRNLFCLFCFTQFWISSFLFFLIRADSFRDYADSFYVTMTSGTICFQYVVQMLLITNFDKLTRKFEDFIEQSNLYSIQSDKITSVTSYVVLCFPINFISDENMRRQYYAKLNTIIERFTNILHSSCYFTLIGVMMPQFILSYKNFFFGDLGNESFYLPIPVM